MKGTIKLKTKKYTLTVDVIIKQQKISYGRPLYLVSPVSGKGSAWMEKVTPCPKKA